MIDIQKKRVIKERPILFSAPMVQAILAGTKTQTRRIVKPQPELKDADNAKYGTPHWWPCNKAQYMLDTDQMSGSCPYGKVGDKLWVRETWFVNEIYDDLSPVQVEQKRTDCPVEEFYGYTATDEKGEGGGKSRPSIFMPRIASRILLEITDIRVERLQDISQEEAKLEGLLLEPVVAGTKPLWRATSSSDWCSHPKTAFRQLWQSINGEESWSANPWVWVLEFKDVTPPK